MDSKPFYLSVTIWGAILSFLIPIVTPTLQKYGVPVPDTSSLAGKIVEGLTMALTVWGRFRATQPVHVVAPTTP